MRVIDKTPFQDEQGNISLIARIQGTLKYGLSWYSELEAQKRVIAYLDRVLEKGFVLIRNFPLPDSEIVIPLILIGPGSLSVILVSPVKGQFEAKGADWNIITNGVAAPASRNLIDLVGKLSRVFQKYMQVHNINIPMQPEPVLIASDPGAQIESVRPMVRVVRSDAIKQFANTLSQASPVLRTDLISIIADLIIEPQPKTIQPSEPDATPEERAKAIFNASEAGTIPPGVMPPSAQPRGNKAAQPAPKKSRPMSRTQLIMLVVLGIFECCVLAGGVYFLFFFNS
ncbi:MAG: hypothetical protein J0L96_11370 [Anaerolineae bacterium]|nr:hypothetical protein [Anaerolineae bacterium]